MRPNTGRRSLLAGFVRLGGLAGRDARPRDARAETLADDPLDVAALERFLLEQRRGERVEDRPMLLEQGMSLPEREVSQVLLLVIDEATGGVRDRVVVGGQAAGGELRAHSVLGH